MSTEHRPDDELEALVFACLESADPQAELARRTAGRPELFAAAARALEQVQRLEGRAPEDAVAIEGVEIQGLIAKGGQAAVYRGRQLYLDRPVAVKVLAQQHDPALVSRFRLEARTLAGLSHPHIVTCHQAGVTDGRCYLVMELIDGPNLRHLLNDHGPLPVGTALSVIAAMCEALATAHAAGIVHRDVKPENVLLKPRPEALPDDPFPYVAKLADLGLARLVRTGPAGTILTRAGMLLGTPETMAPEQIDDPAGADHRADIYGLGCVLFHALTGRPAFSGTMSQVLAAKATWPEPDPASMATQPPAVAQLLRNLLAREPAERPQSYAELRERLQQVQASLALPVRKRRRVLAAAVAILFVAAAVLVVRQLIVSPPNAPSASTPLRVEIVSKGSLIEGSDVTLEALVTSATGQPLGYRWSQSRGPEVALLAADKSAMHFAVPRGAAGIQMGFEVEVTGAPESVTQPTTFTIEPDPAAVPIEKGATKTLFATREQPLGTGWGMTSADDWFQDDDAIAPGIGVNANHKNGRSEAWHALPPGAWELRGTIAPGGGTQTAGIRIELPGGHAAAIELSREEPSLGHARFRARFACLRRDRGVGSWTDVVAHAGTEARIDDSPMPLHCTWDGQFLRFEWAGRSASVRPAEWRALGVPGQLFLYVDDGMVSFRDFVLSGR